MKSRRATPEQRRERAELDPRFGKIGISAVAAALRYRSDAQESRLCAAAKPAATLETEARRSAAA